MDYEKKYKEALEWARKVMQGKVGFVLDEVLEIFPELAESKDERIRKTILSHFESFKQWVCANGISKEDCISWLEEQGKHANFRNKIQIGDKVTRNEDGVLVNLSQLNRVAKKDEKQGEQKPVVIIPKFRVGDKVKSIIDGFECTIESIDNICYYGDTTNFDIQDQDGWELVEQKPAEWSEEDKKRIDQICEDLRCGIINFNAGKIVKGLHFEKIIESNIAWLKELAERIAMQPKQEWSEEDEKMLSDIVKDLVHPWNEYIPDRIEEEIKWLKNKLKSLRPQSTWKPSEKQMETLEYYMHTLVCNEHKEILFGLYADLKKLKE